jgi:hypothetical protein
MNNSKSGVRLRKIKRTNKILQRKHLRFKKSLITRLAMLDDELYSLSQSHSFLHNSVMTLAADELDTEFWLSGARANYHWLKKSDRRISEQLQQLREWANQ